MKEIDSEEEAEGGSRRPRSDQVWFTIAELAIEYHISKATIRFWLKTGKLNSSNGGHRLGNSWRINRVEFETKFMDQRGKNN